MKIFLLNLILSVSASTDATGADDYAWVLETLQEETTTLASVATEGKIKVVDAFGNVVREISKVDFNENSMDSMSIMTLAKSSFMFDSLGDSYYLLEN